LAIGVSITLRKKRILTKKGVKIAIPIVENNLFEKNKMGAINKAI
jgi:hypothetical protein